MGTETPSTYPPLGPFRKAPPQPPNPLGIPDKVTAPKKFGTETVDMSQAARKIATDLAAQAKQENTPPQTLGTKTIHMTQEESEKLTRDIAREAQRGYQKPDKRFTDTRIISHEELLESASPELKERFFREKAREERRYLQDKKKKILRILDAQFTSAQKNLNKDEQSAAQDPLTNDTIQNRADKLIEVVDMQEFQQIWLTYAKAKTWDDLKLELEREQATAAQDLDKAWQEAKAHEGQPDYNGYQEKTMYPQKRLKALTELDRIFKKV